MTSKRVTMTLGLYILAMGILGVGRTGAAMPLILNGTLAAVTVLCAITLSSTSRSMWKLTLAWVGMMALLYLYMVVGKMPGHDNLTAGSIAIFGSTSLLCFVSFFLLLVFKPSFGRPQSEQHKS